MLIQRNISAPSTLLDFPTLETFERELTTHHYDVVGISSITDWLEESAESTKFRVPVAQRGFRPSRENIAARVRLPEEPALTAVGD